MPNIWNKIKQALAMEERTQIDENLIAVAHPAHIDYMKREVFAGDVILGQICDEYEMLNARTRRQMRQINGGHLKKAAKVFKKIKFQDKNGHKIENPGFFNKEKGGMSNAAKKLVYGRTQ